KTTFAIEIRGLTLEIPDDLKVRLPDSAMLSVHLQPATDEKSVVLELRNTGDSKRDDQRRVRIYTFRPGDKQRLTYRPGDTLWAELPVGDGQMFTWALNRSTIYQFERLLRPPRLHKSGEPPTKGELAKEVRLQVVPEDGIPRVPDLLPVAQLK